MRSKNIFTISLLIILLLIGTFPVHSSKITEKNELGTLMNNSLSYFYDTSVNGYKKFRTTSNFAALDNLLASTIFMQLNEQENLTSLKEKALNPLEFSRKYLSNPYLAEKRGIVSWFKTDLGDLSYTISPRYARDQLLYIYALSQAENILESESTARTYNEIANKTWNYLNERLYDSTNGGWFSHLLLSDESESVDLTKRTFDLSLMSYFLSQLDLSNIGVSKDLIKIQVKSTLDFLRNNLIDETNGAITSFFNPLTGTSTDFSARDNAIYGLANLVYFSQFENNVVYKNQAVNVWNFINDVLWDAGFGGLFTGTDGLVPNFAGKGLEDQIQYSLLSLHLWGADKTNLRYLDRYLETDSFIKNYLYDDKSGRFFSSVDRFGTATSEFEAISSIWGWYYLINTPRIVSIEYDNNPTIGLDTEIKFKIYSPIIQEYDLTIEPSDDTIFKSHSESLMVDGLTEKVINLPYVENPQASSIELQAELKLQNTSISEIDWFLDILPNTRIPSGFLYLIGAGILFFAIVIVRRPPEWLKIRVSSVQGKYQDLTKDLTEQPDSSGDEK
ncbi:MAG: hypothetical protein ACW98A_07520 [Candidatus Hodarchaeales archaeon]|jgi:hypothetical protein